MGRTLSATFAVRGTATTAAMLDGFGARAREIVAGELYQEAEAIMDASKRIVPVDTGALRGSGYVDAPAIEDDGTISVQLGYGGPSAPYAVYVHENLSARHNPPTRAKFLEEPLLAALPAIPERIARALVAELGGD